ESLEEQAQNLEAAVAVFNIGKAASARNSEALAKTVSRVRPPMRSLAERRGPNRAPNVARLQGKPTAVQAAAPRAKVAAAGGGGEEPWEEF
ncbi:MAG: methyl-accepting chemotaxis protein, partial [Comamonadaceae bacterium]